MAGCLSLAGFTSGVILSWIIMPAIHHRGPWVWFGVSLLAGLAGICLLAYAKLPLYRQGVFMSFGSSGLSAGRLTAYKWAWRFILAAICIQGLLILILR